MESAGKHEVPVKGMRLLHRRSGGKKKMKLIIDNANIDEIRSMYEFFPMDGG